MSYTTKILWIDKNTLDETLLNSFTEDYLIKQMAKPIAQDPKYLLLLKDNEFIVIDKQGNIKLRKALDYTPDGGAINNNGIVAIVSGAVLHVYDINGDEILSKTFTDTLSKYLRIGNNYLWVRTYLANTTIYVYNLSDLSYTSFSLSLSNDWNIDFKCNENGDEVIGGYGGSDEKVHLFTADPSGIVKDVNTGYGSASTFVLNRPDNAGALILRSHSTLRQLWLVNHNLDYVTVWSKDYGVYGARVGAVIDINLTKGIIFSNQESIIYKYTFDLNAMTYEQVDTLDLVDTPEQPDAYISYGDMTPDGKYAVIPASDIKIIDYESLAVVKTIPKSFVNTPIRILTT